MTSPLDDRTENQRVVGDSASADTVSDSIGPFRSLLRAVIRVYCEPSALFRELAIDNPWRSALALLVVGSTLLSWAIIATGVPDYEVDRWTEKEITRTAQEFAGTDQESELDQELESLDRQRDFWKFIDHLARMFQGPIRILIVTLFLTWSLYALVAVTGGKQKTPLLLGVVVFASFVQIPQMLLTLTLVEYTGAIGIDLTAGAFISTPEIGPYLYALLRQADPFAFWFWTLIGIGLFETRQSTAKGATGIAVGLLLVTTLMNSVWEVIRITNSFRLE